jgi:hypothetical protein
MKTTLILLLSCAAFVSAQDQKTAPPTPSSPPAQDDSQELKRLASVTWDLDTHKLVWVVQKGVDRDGQFVVQSTDRYEVSPSDAFMALKEEKRGIAGDEASSLHDLLGVLSLYCVESTVWWENGGDATDAQPAGIAPDAPKPGEKTVDKKSDPKADPAAKPTRVDQPAKPAFHLLPGALVADNGSAK